MAGVEALIAAGADAAPRAPDPELPEPRRLHAVAEEAPPARDARGRARHHDLRGRPLRRAALQRRVAADDAVARRRRQSRLRVVLLEDRLPGHPRRLPRRPGEADRADREARDEHLHLAEHGRPVDRQRVLPRRRGVRALDRDGQGRAGASARRRCPRRCARELPEARFVEPQGGYFLWVEMPEGTDGDALFAAAAERGVQIVKGTDFLLEGGENAFRLAYSGVTVEQIEEGVARLADAVRSLGRRCLSVLGGRVLPAPGGRTPAFGRRTSVLTATRPNVVFCSRAPSRTRRARRLSRSGREPVAAFAGLRHRSRARPWHLTVCSPGLGRVDNAGRMAGHSHAWARPSPDVAVPGPTARRCRPGQTLSEQPVRCHGPGSRAVASAVSHASSGGAARRSADRAGGGEDGRAPAGGRCAPARTRQDPPAKNA